MNTIIQELNKMAEVALKPEDQERWANAMKILSQKFVMEKDAEASLHQLINYTGSDFVFERSAAPIAPGTIVHFKLGNMTPSIPAYVHARHEYSGKWKYDIILAVLHNDGWHNTRIYNVESAYLTII